MSSWCCSRMTSIQPRQGTASFLSTLALINCESIGEPFFRSFLSCRHLALILERLVGMFEKAFDISEHCISLANGATSAMRDSATAVLNYDACLKRFWSFFSWRAWAVKSWVGNVSRPSQKTKLSMVWPGRGHAQLGSSRSLSRTSPA